MYINKYINIMYIINFYIIYYISLYIILYIICIIYIGTQEFFRAGEVSEKNGTSISVS